MELLSPAGNMESLFAAIRNGADAVYLGLHALNARAGAGNFSRDELVSACEYCHERGKKVYVTVNTLVKEKEMPMLEDVARQLSDAGADAAIVQDFGVGRALRQMLPNLALHASTQMALHNRYGARFCIENGYARMIIAREATLSDIRECADEGVEVEAFGHGALCVACSGQCLFSSMVGGRSGNRGMCAQPCRLPYTLAEKTGYLLSPKDLMTLPHIKALRDAGVVSLKLEGRLKRPEYVAVVTKIYREAIDGIENPNAANELRQIFNRGGFTKGYFFGVDDAELMSTEKPNHMGVAVGRALGNGKILLEDDVAPADQLLLNENPISLSGRKGEYVSCERGGKGIVYRLAHDEQLRRARQSWQEAEKPSVPIAGAFAFRKGERATLSVSDGAHTAFAEGDIVQPAQKPARRETLEGALRKTGGTPYFFEKLDMEIDEGGYLPVSAINNLRRDALSALSDARQKREMPLYPLNRTEPYFVKEDKKVRLSVEGSDWDILREALRCGADEISFSPKDLTNLACPSDLRFALKLPPVCPAEDLEALHRFAEEHAAQITSVVIANAGQLSLKWRAPIRADFMLNAANDSAVSFLWNAGCDSICPSIELTRAEALQLSCEREWVVYGRIALMQLAHCPKNASLGGGKHAACTRCDMGNGSIEDTPLIDRRRVRFPLERIKTSRGCIVRVLNSVPMSLHARNVPQEGIWRIILTDEDMDKARAITSLFRDKIDGKDIGGRAADFEATSGHFARETP
ncbi:MAG: peptidase U32 family protein [Christensenellales bacterium]|jgi:putative protease